ncbi:MAG: signal peptidase II [Lachnospiraceae bacterium]|nr:signal peptidase II [Lachnospiraceae bacterium]
MICLFFALCILGLDLFVKKQIEAREDAAFPVVLAGGFILEKHHNYGFMLNRLDRHPKLVRIVSLLTFLPLLGWFLWLLVKKDSGAARFGAACLAGGAASNLYDRLSRGYVVDYLRLPMKKGGHMRQKIRHVIFNIADLFIFLGGAFTALYSLLKK